MFELVFCHHTFDEPSHQKTIIVEPLVQAFLHWLYVTVQLCTFNVNTKVYVVYFFSRVKKTFRPSIPQVVRASSMKNITFVAHAMLKRMRQTTFFQLSRLRNGRPFSFNKTHLSGEN